MNLIKDYIKKQYSNIVSQQPNDADSCCSTGICDGGFNQEYKDINGYVAEADYGLGCGLPTEYAKLKPGQTVLDLGSGAGNDCFVARSEVGNSGKIYGIDFSEVMIAKARANAIKLGYKNVDFILGDIEDIPLEADSIDVIISNCVLNLVPNKTKVFSSMYRVLKPGGHFSISDLVTSSTLPQEMLSDKGLISACISGAMPKASYLKEIEKAGFQHITILKERELALNQTSSKNSFSTKSFKIYSVTIFAQK